ncbi:CbtB domain-containing protein, partial [Pseudomonas aeruginosa]
MSSFSTTAVPAAQRLSATRSLLLQLSAGAALGLVVLYGVAFAESPLAH